MARCVECSGEFEPFVSGHQFYCDECYKAVADALYPSAAAVSVNPEQATDKTENDSYIPSQRLVLKTERLPTSEKEILRQISDLPIEAKKLGSVTIHGIIDEFQHGQGIKIEERFVRVECRINLISSVCNLDISAIGSEPSVVL